VVVVAVVAVYFLVHKETVTIETCKDKVATVEVVITQVETLQVLEHLKLAAVAVAGVLLEEILVLLY
jgi:hypothetical protein